jgi:Lrp/AsnC family transcriptional regulator for asnA, asnC and gidA
VESLSDLDRKMLKLLLQTDGRIHSHEIGLQLGISASTIQRRRKRLEEEYLIKSYSLDPLKFGWRKIDFLIATEGGSTMTVGQELMKRSEVTYVARSIGEHTIDLRVETFIKDNSELLNLLEDVKGMAGVKDVVWSEIVEVIGRKAPPNHLVKQLENHLSVP